MYSTINVDNPQKLPFDALGELVALRKQALAELFVFKEETMRKSTLFSLQVARRFLFLFSFLFSQWLCAATANLPTTLPALSIPEDLLYEEIVRAYRKDDVDRMTEKIRLLREKAPQSAFLDNALYLRGLSELSANNFSAALKTFDSVISEYPNSDRRVAAEFAKGVLFKRMGLKEQAEQRFINIKQRFPGSVEARRSDFELQLIKAR